MLSKNLYNKITFISVRGFEKNMNFIKCKKCQREYFETDDKCPFCGQNKNEEVVEDNITPPVIDDPTKTYSHDPFCNDVNGFEVIVRRTQSNSYNNSTKGTITMNGKPVTNPIAVFFSLGFVVVFIIFFLVMFLTSFINEFEFEPFLIIFLMVPLFMLIMVIIQIIKTIKKINEAKRNNISFKDSLKVDPSNNNKCKHECVYYDSFSSRVIIYTENDDKFSVKLKDVNKINFNSLLNLLSVDITIDDKKKKVIAGFTTKEDYLRFKSIVDNRRNRNILDY